MERDALIWTKEFMGETSVPVADNHQAHLLIEVD